MDGFVNNYDKHNEESPVNHKQEAIKHFYDPSQIPRISYQLTGKV
jgi:hypothetical protein